MVIMKVKDYKKDNSDTNLTEVKKRKEKRIIVLAKVMLVIKFTWDNKCSCLEKSCSYKRKKIYICGIKKATFLIGLMFREELLSMWK